MTAPTATASERLTRGYLHQVDVVRLLTFGTVIAVHVIAATTPPQSLPARGTLMLLHFTRETFFVITGFVLVHSYYRRRLDVPVFWRRRYLLIGVPYLTWSLFYWAQHVAVPKGVSGDTVRDLGVRLLTGTAEYHLYFLLVSMQVYLVFPLLLRLVRASARRPWLLLGASAALQLAWFWLLHDVLPSWDGQPRWLSAVARYKEQLLPSYQLYVVAGALVTEGVYLLQVATGTQPARASEVLQPVMVGWTLVVTAALLAAGLVFALRRRGGLASSAVREGSRISFGVFLVHPLVITVLLATWPGAVLSRVPAPGFQVLLWVATALGSLLFAELAARSPLSLPLTGRRRNRRRPPSSPSSPPLDPGDRHHETARPDGGPTREERVP